MAQLAAVGAGTMEVYHVSARTQAWVCGQVTTQAAFDRLPYLWPRKLFQQITGLNHHDLKAAVESGQIDVFYPKGKGKGYARYYKRDAAKMAGFKM